MRADAIAGITVALLLVPQSMAYAQLAGLPVVYGLYASIVPVIIASMWGSCNQLHTAPVAMLSLMSAAALIPFAAMGTDKFLELSIMLGLMVGVLRLGLGAPWFSGQLYLKPGTGWLYQCRRTHYRPVATQQNNRRSFSTLGCLHP